MRFYFEVEKRAARLERAGEPPTARTPIILAIDEFQNISDLKLLDTILSESRKYGLYLWMVNQNIQQIQAGALQRDKRERRAHLLLQGGDRGRNEDG